MESELVFERSNVIVRPVLSELEARLLAKELGDVDSSRPLELQAPNLKPFLERVWYQLLAPDLVCFFEGLPTFTVPHVVRPGKPISPRRKIGSERVLVYLPVGAGEGGDLFLPFQRWSSSRLPPGYAVEFPETEMHGLSKLRSGQKVGLLWIATPTPEVFIKDLDGSQ